MLAGCDCNGVNAFFVRVGLRGRHDRARRPRRGVAADPRRGPGGADEQFAPIAHLPLVDVA